MKTTGDPCWTAVHILEALKKKKAEVPFYMEAIFACGKGTYINSSDEKNTLSPINVR